MWVRIKSLSSWIIEDSRRAFYYIAGQVVDLPVPWAAKFLAEGTAEPAEDPEEPSYADPFIPPLLGDEPLTVACVWRTGGKYDRDDYAGKLARAVARNLSAPHRVVCLTDSITAIDGAETVPLERGWPGYWSKIELYRPGLFRGPVLYLDLDTIVSGSMDDLATISDPLTIAWDIQRGWLNSSFLLSRVDLSGVWEAMLADPEGVMRKYDSGDGRFWGDQGLLQDVLAEKRIPWRWVQSVCPHRVVWMPPGFRGQAAPAGTAIELWYGDPKPAEMGGAWLAKHWV